MLTDDEAICVGRRYYDQQPLDILCNNNGAETDSQEFSGLIHDLDQASMFRKETMDFARKSLMDDADGIDNGTPQNYIVASWAPIADALRQFYNQGKLIHRC